MKNFITITDTIKATSDQTNIINHSNPVKAKPAFRSFNRLAPNMVGMARKKENSAAINLEVPNRVAPIIVDPDLDVPGTRARHWKRPINRAVL